MPDVINKLTTIIKVIIGLIATLRKKSESSTSVVPAIVSSNLTEEGLEEILSLNDTYDWRKKHLSFYELEVATNNLFKVLHQDLKMPTSTAKMCMDHVLGIKAMYNAGYSRDYMKKLTVKKNLVQELQDTKIKLREMNKQYARASNTIFELKAKLALAWHREVDEKIKYTLNRIEKIHQELMDKND